VITDIIMWKHPEAQFTYQGDGETIAPHQMPNGDAAAGLTWLDGSIAQPDEATLALWQQEYEAHLAATEFSRNRLAEYVTALPLHEVIEALFEKLAEADSTKFDDLQAKRQAIKAKFPTPGE